MEAAEEGGVPDLDCWATAGRTANSAEEARIRSEEARRFNFMRVSKNDGNRTLSNPVVEVEHKRRTTLRKGGIRTGRATAD
jgi:hypothetical protein